MSDAHKIDHELKLKEQDLATTLHNFNVDPVSSHIYLFGEETYAGQDGVEESGEPGVEFVMANRFIRNINLCMRANPNDPILIHMKTCGGYWEEGMAIHNAIKACPVPVTILNYTHARSMSSLIFQAANKRVMMPDSYFMFHEGTEAFSGTYKQFHSYATKSRESAKRMVQIYVESMKERGRFSHLPDEKIARIIQKHMDKKEDAYLTAEEAVDWGLADEIFGVTCPYDWKLLTQYTSDQLARG